MDTRPTANPENRKYNYLAKAEIKKKYIKRRIDRKEVANVNAERQKTEELTEINLLTLTERNTEERKHRREETQKRGNTEERKQRKALR